MAELKTTQERRDRFRSWLHDDTRDRLSIRAWCVAEDACDDVDTLLAENARLRAAEAEGERLRALAAEARDMLRAMPWRRGGDALVARLDRAALGEP